MIRLFVLASIIVLLTFWASTHHPYSQTSAAYEWKRGEMARTGIGNLKAMYDNEQVVTVKLNSTEEQSAPQNCGDHQSFDLYYFKGKNFDLANNTRKTILYITGGPGRIPQPHELLFLEFHHNVVYFHPRGVGLSRIPGSNSCDVFLSAEFVVGDIERLRTKILGTTRKWDAIYALSYGTVIAQQYAWKHPDNVKRLILESPVARHKDTRQAGMKIALDNLERVYNLFSSSDSTPCDCTVRTLKAKIEFNGDPEDWIERGDNFCFLRNQSSGESHEQPISMIRSRLEAIYTSLENQYGALGFVTEQYDDLQDTGFRDEFPYPEEFFVALRRLQSFGAPQDGNSLVFGENVRSKLVNPAMILGYYAMFDREELLALRNQGFKFKADAPFFSGITDDRCTTENVYVERVKQAINEVRKDLGQTESQRALYVFGLHDGMHPWLPKILNENADPNKQCVSDVDLQGFVQLTSEKHKVLRQQARKIGIIPGGQGCLWDPGKKDPPHEVQTLILKGGSDAVTAGCQAEEFFNHGLAQGKGVFIKFPAMGHILRDNIRFWKNRFAFVELLTPEDESDWGNAYRILIEKFLTLDAPEYRSEEEVKKQLKRLQGEDRTSQAGECQMPN